MDGLQEVDWETEGQRQVRNEVGMIADRWHWSMSEIMNLTVRTRRAYAFRVREFQIKERNANKRGK